MSRLYAPLFTRFFIPLLLASALVPAPAQEEEATTDAPPQSELEEWRSTLRYGINEELLELLPQLASQKVRELEEDIVDLYTDSPDTGVQTACLDFFTALDSYEARDESLEKLTDYEDLPTELVQAILRYLQIDEPDLSRRERDLIRDIASQKRVEEIVPPALSVLALDHEDPSFFIELYE